MRVFYAPFLGLTVFAGCLLAFACLSQAMSWLGLLGPSSQWVLIPFAGVGLLAAAPIPGVVPTDGLASLALSLFASWLIGFAVHRLRPQARTLSWFLLTTALLVGLSILAHFAWRQTGHDWPDWLAYVRDLAP